MYRIFINDRPLILSSSETAFAHSELTEIEHYSCASCMSSAIAKLEGGHSDGIALIADNVSEMWGDFVSRYTLIEAAGGVVVNPSGDVLWIRRNDKWDLPKGKVELGEAIEETAVREVEEECAVTELKRGELLGITYHTYAHKGEGVLKKSYWYAMTCSSEQELVPQLEEGITNVVWANKEMHLAYMQDTYTSITELLRREKLQRYLGF